MGSVLIALALALSLGMIATPTGAQEVVLEPGFVPNQVDSSYELGFLPPPQHVEAPDITANGGLFKAYKLPAPDGRSRSFFTVAFQKKADRAGLRTLTEFTNVDLQSFKSEFPSGVIAKVNIQGRIPAKLRSLGFPLEMFMFKGNEHADSSAGDALALFFATPDGYWSVVWTIPQAFMQQGLPVFFEPFMEGLTATPRLNPK